MKRCPKCGQIYPESDVNFCLNDGELLSRDVGGGQKPFADDDSPPTLLMDPPRVTNQTNWAAPPPPALYQRPDMRAPDVGGAFSARTQSPDQTMAVVSLALGISSIAMVCCYGGIWLGVPAAIVGLLALRNIQSDPERNGGRGLAIGGMVTGIITFILSILFLILAVLA